MALYLNTLQIKYTHKPKKTYMKENMFKSTQQWKPSTTQFQSLKGSNPMFY